MKANTSARKQDTSVGKINTFFISLPIAKLVIMVRDSTILFATAGVMLAAFSITGALSSDQMMGDTFVLFLGALVVGFVAYLGAAVSLRQKGE